MPKYDSLNFSRYLVNSEKLYLNTHLNLTYCLSLTNTFQLSKEERSEHAHIFSMCSDVMELIQDIPVPVLCEVGGLATAAGCQLVASCDIAIASDQAKFSTPG